MEDFAAAEEDLATFTQCAEVNALGPYIIAAAGLRGELEIQRGRTGDALGAVEESLSRLRAARYELLTTPFSIALIKGLILDSRLDEARDLVATTLANCDANGERFAAPELLRLKAKVVRLSEGAPDASIALLEDALTLSRAQGARAWELKVAIDLAKALTAEQKMEEATALLEAVWPDSLPGALSG
jgi:predicted ATPase